MVALVFYRDALVSYLRVGAATYAFVMAARLSGKIKAVVQGILTICVTLMIAAKELHFIGWNVHRIAYWGMAVVTIVTLWSAMDYLYGFSRIVKNSNSSSNT